MMAVLALQLKDGQDVLIERRLGGQAGGGKQQETAGSTQVVHLPSLSKH
jgi:hypothetical protein